MIPDLLLLKCNEPKIWKLNQVFERFRKNNKTKHINKQNLPLFDIVSLITFSGISPSAGLSLWLQHRLTSFPQATLWRIYPVNKFLNHKFLS